MRALGAHRPPSPPPTAGAPRVQSDPRPAAEPDDRFARSAAPGPAGPAPAGAATVPLGPWAFAAVPEDTAPEAEALRAAVGLPNDARGRAMGRLLVSLGYTEVETWRLNRASLTVGRDEQGVELPVLRNPETSAALILHETPAALRAWREITQHAPVGFAGRFSWSNELRDGQPEGVLVLRAGAEPYHLAEEHFHHQFSRAVLLVNQGKDHLAIEALPRAGDSEAYAATMADRKLAGDPELAGFRWNGQRDLAAHFEGRSNEALLRLCLAGTMDLAPIAKGSVNDGDGRPNRPTRPIERLRVNEPESVGIARFGGGGLLAWEAVKTGNAPWTATDEAETGLSRAALTGSGG